MRGLHLHPDRHILREMVHSPYFWLAVGLVLFLLLVYLAGLNETGMNERFDFYLPY